MTSAQKIEVIVQAVAEWYGLTKWQSMFLKNYPAHIEKRAIIVRLSYDVFHPTLGHEYVGYSDRGAEGLMKRHPANQDYRAISMLVKKIINNNITY
jgi:hypothetical protein